MLQSFGTRTHSSKYQNAPWLNSLLLSGSQSRLCCGIGEISYKSLAAKAKTVEATLLLPLLACLFASGIKVLPLDQVGSFAKVCIIGKVICWLEHQTASGKPWCLASFRQ